MQQYKQQLLLQWRQNPRLRIGVVLIILIIATNGLLTLNDYRLGLFDEYSRQNKKLIKLRQIQQQTGLMEKAESIRNIRLQLENGLWRAESKGLAQANALTWFNEKIHQLNLNSLEVTTASVNTDPKMPIIWQVPIELKGTLYDTDLLELLNYIEQNPKLVQIEQLQLKRDQKNLLGITLLAYCYFQAPEQ